MKPTKKYRRSHWNCIEKTATTINFLAYQIAGQSASGNIPGWRRINVDEMSLAKVTSQPFVGQRPYPSGEHSDFDTILAAMSDKNDITD